MMNRLMNGVLGIVLFFLAVLLCAPLLFAGEDSPPPPNNKLKVVKIVDWNGVTPNPNQVFQICIQGPSYPSGNCKTVDYDGGEVVWEHLQTGDYTITEDVSETLWNVEISDSHVHVCPGPMTVVTITNTHLVGSLEVTKQVDWSGLSPNQIQGFSICITGPSFPQGDCKTIGYEGGMLTWSGLIPGEYTVCENDPGCQWDVEIIGSPVTVVGYGDTGELVESAGLVEYDPPDDECGPAEVTVINTHKLGSLKVNKCVDWNGVPVDLGQTFTVCITGPSYPQGDCKEVGYQGGELVWGDLIPGCYEIAECDPGCAWNVSISSTEVGVAPCGPPSCVTIENQHKLGTLNINKVVDWNDVDPDTGLTFEICITGPSHLQGSCQTIGYQGGVLTWDNLIPGSYTITETDLGEDWKVLIDPNPVEVGVCEPNEATVTNICHAPPGTIIIKKLITEDCVPLCCEEIFFDFEGDIGGQLSQDHELVFDELPHGLYSTTEVAPGDWLVESITVDDDNSTVSIEPDGKTGTVIFELEPGEVITAVFTNRKPVVALEMTSSVGGQVLYPGEGDFEFCQDTVLCLEVEIANPLFTFLGWRGTYFANAPGQEFDANTPIVDICGDPIDVTEMGPITMGDCTLLTLEHNHEIRAVFQSVLDVLYVDDNAPNDPGPYNLLVGDPYECGTIDHPFDSVQEAIEVAKPGATVVVLSGTYPESLVLSSKTITVTSDDPDSNEPVLTYPVIQAEEGLPAVTFYYCSDPNMVLDGLVLSGGNDNSACGLRCLYSDVVVQNCLVVGNRRLGSATSGGGGLWCNGSEVTLVNCTLAQNYGGPNGAGVYATANSDVMIVDSILWDNLPAEVLLGTDSVVTIATSDVAGGYSGDGNLDVDPVFVGPGHWEHSMNPGTVVMPSHDYAVWVAGDYHLIEGSPCIDAGDPLADYSQEPEPNGGVLNMGAYGNTPQATTTTMP